ncbi:hypothetical protein NDU88_012009 [Pleurodeles waltl]|uniref:Uncharacterized protein n=1 Tax=Pleurodeles waltl TaxID=8319 RepID=A0AAV7R0F8_PLEWA|nr:hypothetical protein NDU88_012009 [Pleurodeles waltl]
MKPHSRSSASLRGRAIRPLTLSRPCGTSARGPPSNFSSLTGARICPRRRSAVLLLLWVPSLQGPRSPYVAESRDLRQGRKVALLRRTCAPSAGSALPLPVSLRFKSDTGGRRLLPGALCCRDDRPGGLRNGQISGSVVGRGRSSN